MVMCEPFGLSRSQFRKCLLKNRGNPRMQILPAGTGQRAVRDILQQSMPESVFGVRRDRDDRGGKHVDDILRGLPYGKVLCIVRITGIEETNPMMLEGIAGREQLFGNYEEGRYAWHLHMVDVFEPPIPAKGNRMLWN